MSDWQRTQQGRSGSKGKTIGLTAVGLVVLLGLVALGFGIGRWTQHSAPTTTAVAALQLNNQGVPSGYAPTVAGARAAAVNAVIGGLALRPGSASLDLKMLGAQGQDWSPSLRLLLNTDVTTCVGFDTSTPVCPVDNNPQRSVDDFAPRASTAGWVTGSYVTTAPESKVNSDATAAAATVVWLQSRTKDGTTLTWQGTQFQIAMVRQGNDWKLSDVVATAVPNLAKPVTPWLSVIGFIGQDGPT